MNAFDRESAIEAAIGGFKLNRVDVECEQAHVSPLVVNRSFKYDMCDVVSVVGQDGTWIVTGWAGQKDGEDQYGLVRGSQGTDVYQGWRRNKPVAAEMVMPESAILMVRKAWV